MRSTRGSDKGFYNEHCKGSCRDTCQGLYKGFVQRRACTLPVHVRPQKVWDIDATAGDVASRYVAMFGITHRMFYQLGAPV